MKKILLKRYFLALNHYTKTPLEKKSPLDDTMAANALVAQLDRAPGYEPGGQRFESSPVHLLL